MLPILSSVMILCVFRWGHNHRGQLGGIEGTKVKIPAPCDTLSSLRPVDIVGGEQTLFAITAEGRVYGTGKENAFCMNY